MTRKVFLDCETDGLHPKRQIWEVAWIVRDPGAGDVEHHDFLWIDTARSDPAALRVGRYYERHPLAFGGPFTVRAGHRVAEDLACDLHDATIVGANPAFDAEALRRLLAGYAHAPTWHYRLLDIEAMTAGALGWETPRSFSDSMSALGAVIPDDERHTALGDARGVRDLYDRLQMYGADVTAVLSATPEVREEEWLIQSLRTARV